jgi:hypothetical protein
MFAWCSICVISTASPGPTFVGHVLREDRRLWLGIDERGDLFTCAVVGRVGLLRQRVHAAVHVRVVLAQMIRDRVDHDRGLLRGGARVEVDQLAAAVKAPGEDREVGLHVQPARNLHCIGHSQRPS